MRGGRAGAEKTSHGAHRGSLPCGRRGCRDRTRLWSHRSSPVRATSGVGDVRPGRGRRGDPGGVPRKSVRSCSRCGGPLPEGSRKSRRYCSTACRTRGWRREREQWWRTNVEFAAALREGRPYRRPKKRCPVCKSWWFVGEVVGRPRRRVDALYCSPKCCTRAYRPRQSRSAGVTP
ncbi:hypothetical protein GFH48_38595 [Streptomyces fagopyri]|uniref:Uncharacterized protein n=1 Tax=Streptomyces fagopyri TaxID=2662397 RepID=A0A5Q0LRU0_9ACTN|nr:hypothetical protein GFH48_38595 [Streptomyces fagopyri]